MHQACFKMLTTIIRVRVFLLAYLPVLRISAYVSWYPYADPRIGEHDVTPAQSLK